MSLGGLEAFGIVDGDTVDDFLALKIAYLLPSSEQIPDFSSTNPFRGLPSNPAVLAAIKESTSAIRLARHDDSSPPGNNQRALTSETNYVHSPLPA